MLSPMTSWQRMGIGMVEKAGEGKRKRCEYECVCVWSVEKIRLNHERINLTCWVHFAFKKTSGFQSQIGQGLSLFLRNLRFQDSQYFVLFQTHKKKPSYKEKK